VTKLRYFFMVALLERLAQPAFFCRLVSVTLRAAAALIALLSLTIFFKVGKLTFEMAPNLALGGILFEAFYVVAIYAVVHVFFIRARDIEAIKSENSYAIAVAATLAKLAGEAYFAFVSLIAIGGGLFVWFTNQGLGNVFGSLVRSLFPGAGDDPNFMGGIEFMASGIFVGLAVLVVAYAVSQALTMLIQPARNPVPSTAPVELNQTYRSRFGS
jgi:hypothetical protein